MIFKAFKYKGVPIEILSPTLATDDYEEILKDTRGDVIIVFMDFGSEIAHYECGNFECDDCPFQPYDDCETGIFQELLPVMKLTKPRT